MAWAIILDLDNGLKHRLTGAILLVLLAVLLLPELFTGAGDVPRTAPPTAGSAEVPVRRYDIDLTERAQAPAPPAEVPAPEPIPEVPASTSEPAPVTQAVTPPTTPPTATPPTTAPAEPAPGEPQRSAGASGYFVQVGVFSSREGADRVAKSLRGKGFEVAVSRYESGKRLFRVRVGPAADRAAAVALRERLRAAGQAGTLVAPN